MNTVKTFTKHEVMDISVKKKKEKTIIQEEKKYKKSQTLPGHIKNIISQNKQDHDQDKFED